MFQKNNKKNVVLVVAVSVLFGFVGSLSGIYFVQKITSIPFLGIISPFTTGRGDQPIIIDQPRQVTVSFDTAVTNVLRESSNRTGYLYEKPNRLQAGSLPFLTYDDARGLAAALTSDGWFVSSASILKNKNLENVVLDISSSDNHNGYTIEKVVFDEHTELIFFKVNLTSSIPVSRFRNAKDLSLGETIIARSDTRSVRIGSMYRFDDVLRIEKSTEMPLTAFSVDFPSLNIDSTEHTILYDLSGRIVGMTDTEGDFFSTDWDTVVNQVLKGDTIARPYLGLRYLHIDDLIGFSENETPHVSHGAWIRNLPGINAFAIDSPLLETDIQEGDIIVAVQNEPITKDKTLTDLITQYQPTDVILLKTISPEGKEKDIRVQLTAY